MSKGALAQMADDDKDIGRIAAERIIVRNLRDGLALPDMPVERTSKVTFSVSKSVARNHGITISADGLKVATAIFE